MRLRSLFVPAAPQGLTLEEARLAGLVPPAGYKPPPRASLLDGARTALVGGALAVEASTGLLLHTLRPAPSSTTWEGLSAIRHFSLRALARVGVSLEVEGEDRVPREGGLVFMWNQASHLDHLVLGAAMPRPFHSLYNNEVARTPLYGRYLRSSGHFHVDRFDEAQWRASIAVAARRVHEGACVLVSPEGTRSWDGRLLLMKRGALLLAREAARPVVCVVVRGAHERLPRGGLAVRPG